MNQEQKTQAPGLVYVQVRNTGGEDIGDLIKIKPVPDDVIDFREAVKAKKAPKLDYLAADELKVFSPGTTNFNGPPLGAAAGVPAGSPTLPVIVVAPAPEQNTGLPLTKENLDKFLAQHALQTKQAILGEIQREYKLIRRASPATRTESESELRSKRGSLSSMLSGASLSSLEKIDDGKALVYLTYTEADGKSGFCNGTLISYNGDVCWVATCVHAPLQQTADGTWETKKNIKLTLDPHNEAEELGWFMVLHTATAFTDGDFHPGDDIALFALQTEHAGGRNLVEAKTGDTVFGLGCTPFRGGLEKRTITATLDAVSTATNTCLLSHHLVVNGMSGLGLKSRGGGIVGFVSCVHRGAQDGERRSCLTLSSRFKALLDQEIEYEVIR